MHSLIHPSYLPQVFCGELHASACHGGIADVFGLSKAFSTFQGLTTWCLQVSNTDLSKQTSAKQLWFDDGCQLMLPGCLDVHALGQLHVCTWVY